MREAEDGTRKGLGLSSAPKHPVTASNVALNGPGGAAGTGDHGTDGVGTEMGEQRFACATFLAEKRRKKKKQAAKGRTDNPTNLEQEDDSDDPYFTACRVLTYQLLHSPATRNHLLNPSPPEKTWAPSSLTLPSLPPLPHSSPPTLIKPNTTKHLSPKISSLVQLRGDRSMD